MPIIILAIITSVVCGLIFEDAREWSQFKQAHHCKKVGEMSGDVITTIGANGQVAFGSTSSKTGWQCDDGVIYWR